VWQPSKLAPFAGSKWKSTDSEKTKQKKFKHRVKENKEEISDMAGRGRPKGSTNSKRGITSKRGIGKPRVHSYGFEYTHSTGSGPKDTKYAHKSVISGTMGKTTMSSYRWSRQTRPSQGTIDALKIAQRVKFQTEGSYKVTALIDNQLYSDMNNTFVTPYAYTCAIFHGDCSTNSGIFNNLKNLFSQSNTPIAKTFFKDCSVETVIVSACISPLIVDIYEVFARHDVGYAAGISGTAIYSPIAYWIQGDSDQGQISLSR
jgi:hypothetical protein